MEEHAQHGPVFPDEPIAVSLPAQLQVFISEDGAHVKAQAHIDNDGLQELEPIVQIIALANLQASVYDLLGAVQEDNNLPVEQCQLIVMQAMGMPALPGVGPSQP